MLVFSQVKPGDMWLMFSSELKEGDGGFGGRGLEILKSRDKTLQKEKEGFEKKLNVERISPLSQNQ